MRITRITFIAILTLAALFHSCKKDETQSSVQNPYLNPALWPPKDTNKVPELDSGSFAFLYNNVFNRTCANSGCHDGNFPPDFRTIAPASTASGCWSITPSSRMMHRAHSNTGSNPIPWKDHFFILV